jgi:acyl dehydratase
MSFTDRHLFFDDIRVGQEWVSPARTMTETDIVNFAGVSGDFNAVHMDHEFAKTTPFGRPIAHGLLGLSFVSGLALHSPPMRTLAFLAIKDWHFRAPIYAGDTLHVCCKVLAIEPRPHRRRATVTWQRQLINQQGKVVQEGITQTQVQGRAALQAGDESSPE